MAAVAKVEAAPKLDGRNMIMVLAPDRRGQAQVRKPSPNGAAEGGRPPSTRSRSEEPVTVVEPVAVVAAEAAPAGPAVSAPAPDGDLQQPVSSAGTTPTE